MKKKVNKDKKAEPKMKYIIELLPEEEKAANEWRVMNTKELKKMEDGYRQEPNWGLNITRAANGFIISHQEELWGETDDHCLRTVFVVFEERESGKEYVREMLNWVTDYFGEHDIKIWEPEEEADK